jgi:predicted ATPase/DNA-binding winged helix-turn-helix (wHTH) protein
MEPTEYTRCERDRADVAHPVAEVSGLSNGAASRASEIVFGPFRFIPGRQLLLEDGRPVRIGSRARALLSALVESPGEVVSKRDLIARAWPQTHVVEGSLRVHLTALRRAIGDGRPGRRFIVNIPGVGYSFVAPVSLVGDVNDIDAPEATTALTGDVPSAVARVVGRADVVTRLGEQVLEHRFVTIVGAGGIGKTTVAASVAKSIGRHFRDGVRFLDLAPLGDAALLESALASRLGVSVRSDQPLASIIAFLREKEILIVLDGCEHLIEAAAILAEGVVSGAPGTAILATSREPLNVKGERVHRLAPLGFALETAGLTASEALSYPSVQLFADRASESLYGFVLTDADAPLVGDICRRLDGIPLALEIAASHIAAFGVAGLASRIGDRMKLLMKGRRTALPRHRTLTATLDWSHDQLTETERVVLRRLALFAGVFTLESASAVIVDSTISETTAVDALAGLITKSLVSPRKSGGRPLFRLLDTTRAYAFGKLEASGEHHRFAHRHARHHLDLLKAAGSDWEALPVREWDAIHGYLIDDVRAALDWSFAEAGEVQTGVALTIAAVPLWFVRSLISECGERAERALAVPSPDRSPSEEMHLLAALAWSLMQTRGFVDATRAAWARVLSLAEELGDADHQLRALWGLWADKLNGGELHPARVLAERFAAIAASEQDTSDRLVGDRMLGYTLHLVGEQTAASSSLARMIARYEVPTVGGRIIRFVFEQRATARCFRARILWLQGYADQAVRLTREVVSAAESGDDGLTLCQVLVQAACPISLLVGDLESAERHAGILVDHSTRHGLEFWEAYGRCFQAVLLVRRGAARGAAALSVAVGNLERIRYGVLYGVFLTELAEALGKAGRAREGLDVIRQAIARSERNGEGWYRAEQVRVLGALQLAANDADGEAAAERHFKEAMQIAVRQRVPAWELRAVMSLTSLAGRRGRDTEARKLLSRTYAKFTEGFDTADLRSARQLLAASPHPA